MFHFFRRQVQAAPGVPAGVSLPTAKGQIHLAMFSSQRRQPREHLPGHSQGELVRALRCQDPPPLHSKFTG